MPQNSTLAVVGKLDLFALAFLQVEDDRPMLLAQRTQADHLHAAPNADLLIPSERAGEATRLTNRIRGLLTQIFPALERVLGPRLQTKTVLDLLTKHGGPMGMTAAGRAPMIKTAKAANPRGAIDLVDAVIAALSEQTVIVPERQPRPTCRGRSHREHAQRMVLNS